MLKYLTSIGLMMLVGNEIFSLLMLMVIGLLFWLDVAKARFQ